MELVALPHWHDPRKRRLLATKAVHERDVETLWSLVQAYLRSYGRKGAAVSPRTLRNYHVALRDYLAWAWPPDSPAPKVSILEAGRDELGCYLADLQEKGSFLTDEPLTPGTLALRLAGVRVLYRALKWAGAAAGPEGFPGVHDPTPAHERRPALPQALYKRLLEHLSGDAAESRRDHLAARLMGEAGLRLSEVVALEVEHVLLGEGLLEVQRGKGGKARSVPLGRSLVRELESWIKVRRVHAQAGETALLINLGGRKAAGRRMGARMLQLRFAEHYAALDFPARYRGVHTLRHTAGTRFYRGLKDLYATARLLGHADVNTSAIYAKMDLEDLREQVEGLEET